MIFRTVSEQEIRAAQVFTGASFALWMLVGFVPAVRRYAQAIRGVLLAAYLLGCAAFFAYLYFG